MILLPFVDRPPTDQEVEKIRLLLSTFQDGSGYEAGGLLPGWRDFERCVALALGGVARENKGLFDVVLARPGISKPEYGLSCKMRGELGSLESSGRIYIEVSNAAAKFTKHLETKNIKSNQDIAANPQLTAESILELLRMWKEAVDIHNVSGGGTVDLAKSSFLILLYNPPKTKKGILTAGDYELFTVPLDVVQEGTLTWSIPTKHIKKHDKEKTLGLLRGTDANGTVLAEWYFGSGGQLKFYPPAAAATWRSGKFQLEPLPPGTRNGIVSKAEEYFPKQWKDASK